MASPIDILLKVSADVRDAVRGIDQVDKAAKQAEQSVKKTEQQVNQTAQRIGQTLRTVTARGRYGLGAAAGTFAAGGSLAESLGAGLGAASPELAVALLAVQQGQSFVDRLAAGDVQQANARLGAPTSVDDAIAGLQQARSHTGGALGVLRRVAETRSPFFGGSYSPSEYGRAERDRYHDAFRQLVRQHPEVAAGVLARLGNPDDLTKIYHEEQAATMAAATRAQQSAAYLGTLQPASVTNVYSTFSGLGGDSAVGREVTAVLDRRDRNNGRYVTTYTRR